MADDNGLNFILNLDSSDFTASAGTALSAIQSLGDPANLSGLISILGEGAEALGAVGLAAFAFKEALDLTTEGEEVERIDEQFQTLATNAGLSADALKNGLVQAAGGLVPTTELLKIANQAIIEMGASAGQLPAIMELARKATVVFGGDVQTNFQNMVQAIGTGNVRMLKHMGIVVDTTAAVQKYAEENGVAADELSEVGKKHALMNAALEAGQKAFANVTTEMKPATGALQEFKAAWIELKEVVEVIFAQTLGSHLAGTFEALKNSLHGAKTWLQATFGHGAEKDSAGMDLLNSRIDETKKKLDDIANHKGIGATMTTGEAQIQVQMLTAQLQKYEAQLGKTGQVKQAAAAQDDKESQAAIANSNKVAKAEDLNQQQMAKNNVKFEQEKQKLAADTEKEQAKQINSLAEVEQQVNAQRLALAQQHSEALKKIVAEYPTDLKKQRALEDAENKKYAMQVENQEKDIAKTREQYLNQYVENSKNAFDGIGRAAQQESIKAKQGLQDFGKQGQETMASFKKNSTAAFSAIGTAIANNQSIAQAAAQAMKGFFLNMLADRAKSEGELLLLSGIWPPNPLAISAGGALIALGAALSAMAGGGGGGGASAGGGGGGGGGSSGIQSPVTQTAASSQQQLSQQQQTPQRAVTVNIAGHYLNTSESQRTLMEVMRNETDATGFQYNKIGV